MSLLKELLFSLGMIGVMKAQNNGYNNEYHDGPVCIESARTSILSRSQREESIYSTGSPVINDEDTQNRNTPLFLGAGRALDFPCSVQWDIKMVTNAPSCDGELCFALKNADGDTSNVYLNNELYLTDRITASSQELWFIEPAPNNHDPEDPAVNILSVVPNRYNFNNLLCRRSNREETELRADNDRNRRRVGCQWKLKLPTKRRLINMMDATTSNIDEMEQNEFEYVYPATMDVDSSRRPGANPAALSLRAIIPGLFAPEWVIFRADLSEDIVPPFFLRGDIRCNDEIKLLLDQRNSFVLTVYGEDGDILIRDASDNDRVLCILNGNVIHMDEGEPVIFGAKGTGLWRGF